MAQIVIPRLAQVRQKTDGNLCGTGLGWWLWDEVVLVRCPSDHVCWLPHAIDARGEVDPSLVCGVKSCGWHVNATLAGWTDGARTRRDERQAARQKARDLGLR